MIKKEDIRIGNYFLGFDNKPFKWELEHFTMVGSSSIDFDEIIKKPIPLTEEWLLKLGFIKKTGLISGRSFYEDKHFIIDFNNDIFIYFNKVVLNISRPQYVNQIQNLCYALTGEELKAIL